MATPFSAPDEAIINEVVPLSKLTLASTSSAREVPIAELYDTQALCTRIAHHGFKRVALQFPDELLCDASSVVWDMQAKLKGVSRGRDQGDGSHNTRAFMDDRGQPESSAKASNGHHDHVTSPSVELFVLADTSYGNCCVDEVAAEHVDADLVIHFGHACLSPTTRLPTIYVFHKLPIDAEQCAEALADAFSEKRDAAEQRPVLMYDVGYEHAIEAIQARLGRRIQADVTVSNMDKGVNWDRYIREREGDDDLESQRQEAEAAHDTVEASGLIRKNGLPENIASTEAIVLYVGPESLALTNLLLRLGTSTTVIRYDATTCQTTIETGKTNRLLQRRYVAVQKARDAQTVALLVGTLGMRSYLPLLRDLRHHLTKIQGKRVYTISVGKLNPAKLANFQEIDVFVLIACPENSLIDAAAAAGMGNRASRFDSRDFFRPIVTPFELLMAFKGRAWGSEYVLNLEDVYADIRSMDGSSSNSNRQHDSLVYDDRAKSDDDADSSSSDEEPHFSLVTGGLVSRSAKNERNRERRQVRASRQQDDAGSGGPAAGIVVARNKDGTLMRVMESTGAAHVAGRSWRGLEQRIGMDDAAPLETGRTGVAAGYTAGSRDVHEGHGA